MSKKTVKTEPVQTFPVFVQRNGKTEHSDKFMEVMHAAGHAIDFVGCVKPLIDRIYGPLLLREAWDHAILFHDEFRELTGQTMPDMRDPEAWRPLAKAYDCEQLTEPVEIHAHIIRSLKTPIQAATNGVEDIQWLEGQDALARLARLGIQKTKTWLYACKGAGTIEFRVVSRGRIQFEFKWDSIIRAIESGAGPKKRSDPKVTPNQAAKTKAQILNEKFNNFGAG